nr:MAG TPA: hypothetical protein [Caudoviricetes sp.]
MLTTQNIYFIAKCVKLFDYRLNILYLCKTIQQRHPPDQSSSSYKAESIRFSYYRTIFPHFLRVK